MQIKSTQWQRRSLFLHRHCYSKTMYFGPPRWKRIAIIRNPPIVLRRRCRTNLPISPALETHQKPVWADEIRFHWKLFTWDQLRISLWKTITAYAQVKILTALPLILTEKIWARVTYLTLSYHLYRHAPHCKQPRLHSLHDKFRKTIIVIAAQLFKLKRRIRFFNQNPPLWLLYLPIAGTPKLIDRARFYAGSFSISFSVRNVRWPSTYTVSLDGRTHVRLLSL